MKISGQDVIDRCRRIAEFSESKPGTTRTFLCPAVHDVHAYLREWMQSLGMEVCVDSIGNLRGLYRGIDNERRLLIGSHLDTVPDAGAFDGVLGVVLAIALVDALDGQALPFAIEVIGFSEEEGVRFGIPFIGSRALVGRLDDLLGVTDKQGTSVADAIRNFRSHPANMADVLLHPETFAYLEFHIEQGPVLENSGQPLGIVEAIAGQSRHAITLTGAADHAGTTPMHLRRDALAGIAEWIIEVESEARNIDGLVATVSSVHSEPQAGNVIAGRVSASLDVRHASDEVRTRATAHILERAASITAKRGLEFHAQRWLEQPAVKMDSELISVAQRAARGAGCQAPSMTSGAGHDAMIVAEKVPSVMIFVRSPGGISHQPNESVLPDDIELAGSAGLHFVRELASK